MKARTFLNYQIKNCERKTHQLTWEKHFTMRGLEKRSRGLLGELRTEITMVKVMVLIVEISCRLGSTKGYQKQLRDITNQHTVSKWWSDESYSVLKLFICHYSQKMDQKGPKVTPKAPKNDPKNDPNMAHKWTWILPRTTQKCPVKLLKMAKMAKKWPKIWRFRMLFCRTGRKVKMFDNKLSETADKTFLSRASSIKLFMAVIYGFSW
jgi:hypothetical protein